jgi:hypothetical protein
MRAGLQLDTRFASQTTTPPLSHPLKRHCFSKEFIMKAWMGTAAMAAMAASVLTAGAAQAGDVSWTVTVGSPRPAPRVIYAPPPVIYAPPPVVYVPQPVVYQPVYQPVVYAQPVYRIPPGHLKHWHKHGYKYGYGYQQGYRHGRHDD